MKKFSTLSALLFGLFVGVVLSSASCGSGGGGSGGKCSKTNCGGCCDAAGMCQLGTAPAACGAAGNACQLCPGGQICSLGTCKVGTTGTGGGSGTGGSGTGGSGTGGSGTGGSGTGGSGTGGSGTGGSGTGGSSGAGGGPACTTMALSAQTIGGSYFIVRDQMGAPQYSITEGDNQVGPADLLTLEIYDAPGNETPAPYSADLAANATTGCGNGGTSPCKVANCNDCVQIYQGITSFSPFRYTKLFFGQSGTVNIVSKTLVENLADGGTAGGSLRATASNLHLIEWDFQVSGGQVTADQPVSGGACIDITTTSWDAGW